MWTSAFQIRYPAIISILLTIVTMMQTVPTLKDPSTARVLPDTLEMESLVLVSILIILRTFLVLVIMSKATPSKPTQIARREGVKGEMRIT